MVQMQHWIYSLLTPKHMMTETLGANQQIEPDLMYEPP